MNKRFINYLMITIILLVTGSVTVLSTGLYIYITSRLQSEFNENMEAYKGRIEIILKNRIAEIENLTKSISIDNTIRFTTKKAKLLELEDRLRHFTENNPSLLLYIRDSDNNLITPDNIVNPLDGLIEQSPQKPYHEIIFENGNKFKLVWQFDAPITDQSETIGNVYALYDLIHDSQINNEISRTAQGGLLVDRGTALTNIKGTEISGVDPTALKDELTYDNFAVIKNDLVVSPLKGFSHLYYSLSQEDLAREKKSIFFILCTFSISILMVSIGLSWLLGRQMSRPLAEMATMAIQISRGKKDLSFSVKDSDYLEFNQLSQAFNYMLENLKEAEEKARFTELLENVDDAVYLTDENGKLLNANEATYKSLGYQPSAFFNFSLFDILPADDARMVLEHFSRDNGNQDSKKLTFETHLIKNDYSVIPVEVRSRVIHYFKGKAILNVARDVTRRMEAQRILRESEEQYRSLIETSHNGILILDENYKVMYANNRLCQIMGYARDELDAVDFEEIIGLARLALTENDRLQIEKDDGIQRPVETKIRRKDLEERHCFINTTTIKDSGQETTRMVVQILDITDQFRAEQEKALLESHLRQSQKMEAIGNLAGGIAHDFNNLLQIIHGYTEILIFKKDKKDPDYQKLSEVKQAAQRATELTKQLLTFSRKVESIMKPTDMNYEVVQIYNLLKRTIPQMIEIDLQLADELNTINADTSQLGQLIMNLSVNARDAMPEGGKLTIKTKNAVLDEKFCESPEGRGALPGNYVCLSISDTGTGMSQACLEHIYEPFYTTKEVGKGTGLGLAIVYGIINSHKGHIVCNSEEGKGTTFDVYLPALESRIKSDDNETDNIQMSGTETILLVDDDESVRTLGQEMLAKIGHKVITATSGEKALKLYKSKQDEIDLIMLDLLMPGMGGHKCLERLLKINPEAKILIASGHSGKDTNNDEIEARAKGFVSKPYKINEISETIRQIIDAKPN